MARIRVSYSVRVNCLGGRALKIAKLSSADLKLIPMQIDHRSRRQQTCVVKTNSDSPVVTSLATQALKMCTYADRFIDWY